MSSEDCVSVSQRTSPEALGGQLLQSTDDNRVVRHAASLADVQRVLEPLLPDIQAQRFHSAATILIEGKKDSVRGPGSKSKGFNVPLYRGILNEKRPLTELKQDLTAKVLAGAREFLATKSTRGVSEHARRYLSNVGVAEHVSSPADAALQQSSSSRNQDATHQQSSSNPDAAHQQSDVIGAAEHEPSSADPIETPPVVAADIPPSELAVDADAVFEHLQPMLQQHADAIMVRIVDHACSGSACISTRLTATCEAAGLPSASLSSTLRTDQNNGRVRLHRRRCSCQAA